MQLFTLSASPAKLLRFVTPLLLLFGLCTGARAQDHSAARTWNEENLEAIRNDFARPVVHARNLYHVSAAMYDCWSLVHGQGTPALMGTTPLTAIDHWLLPDYPDPEAATEEALSFAAYRILRHRYQNSPNRAATYFRLDNLMFDLGYNPANTDTDYRGGGPAELGNYVAERIIAYGMQDGANEVDDYANLDYDDPVNPPLIFTNPFSIFRLLDPNRWQTLQFPGQVIDQSGNPIGDGPLPFLGAEWGRVTPFALSDDDRTMPTGDFMYGNSPIYHDPGPPPYISAPDAASTQQYRWNFELVLKWSSHLDPNDPTMWDISPGGRGNVPMSAWPTDYADYPDFYLTEGGTAGQRGHSVNPVTGEPYAPNLVPRGDYTRVLAEFWADGPGSETPPGHWFDIFNQVMDHPLFERKFGGQGEELPPLEYEVKAYLTLGGALHDAAISAWSIKGAYDYIRPISAIRWLARNGQASDPDGRSYSVYGLEFDPGYIEELGDVATIRFPSSIAATRARAWVGPQAITDPRTDIAGVDWIDPIVWYPYQRPNFVTPNFAGYVSGHSTFSSAAATVLEALTGSPYFPGGLGEFVAERDTFLVFERGPSVDVVLQWATYRDASNETSLSRIWGGIHPPVDDIPGRFIGLEVGQDAFARASALFAGDLTGTTRPPVEQLRMYPNPVSAGEDLFVELPDAVRRYELRVFDVSGRPVLQRTVSGPGARLPVGELPGGTYFLRSADGRLGGSFVVVR